MATKIAEALDQHAPEAEQDASSESESRPQVDLSKLPADFPLPVRIDAADLSGILGTPKFESEVVAPHEYGKTLKAL